MKILSFYISNYFFPKQTNYTIFTYYSQSFFGLVLLCCQFFFSEIVKYRIKFCSFISDKWSK